MVGCKWCDGRGCVVCGGAVAVEPKKPVSELATKHIRALGGEGILIESDVPELNAAVQKVYGLMRDCQWHTATEIITKSGVREGLRRMRELRPVLALCRQEIERRRVPGSSREFEYRIVAMTTLAADVTEMAGAAR